jgi:hypothetical protein
VLSKRTFVDIAKLRTQRAEIMRANANSCSKARMMHNLLSNISTQHGLSGRNHVKRYFERDIGRPSFLLSSEIPTRQTEVFFLWVSRSSTISARQISFKRKCTLLRLIRARSSELRFTRHTRRLGGQKIEAKRQQLSPNLRRRCVRGLMECSF